MLTVKLVYKNPLVKLTCDNLTPVEAVEKWRNLAAQNMPPSELYINNIPSPCDYGFLVDVARRLNV
jgi:hypothetical protein